MIPADENLRSAGTAPVASLVDTQLRALATVLGANIRYALKDAVGAEKWMSAPVVDVYDHPITLNLLNDYRLPAVAVWRRTTGVLGPGQRRESRRTTFVMRYWLDSTPPEWLGKVWPALQAGLEVSIRTLTGNGLIDLTLPDKSRIPATDILKLAGFEYFFPETIQGATDFAISDAGEVGQLYPVLELVFDAQHVPIFGGLAYPEEVDLPLLEELCVALWDGTQVNGRAVEDQPVVELKVSMQSLEERSRAAIARNGGGQCAE